MLALMRGVEELVLNSPAAIPSDGALSDSYAIPANIRNLTLSVRPVGTYTLLSVSLQVANNDVSVEYTTVYISTELVGETLDIGAVYANFMRIKVNSSTGASRTGLVVGVLAK